MNVNEILSTLKKVVNKQDKNDNRLLTNSKEIVGAINENKLSLEEIAINPMQFGAIGDSVHDDTIPLQNTINYCISNKKPIKLSNKKVYKITDEVLISDIIDFDFNGGELLCGNSQAKLVINNVKQWGEFGIIRNPIIDCNNIADIGFYIMSGYRSTVDNLTIKNSTKTGYQIDKGFENNITSIRVFGKGKEHKAIIMNASDNHYFNLFGYDCHTFIENKGHNFIDKVHAWLFDPTLFAGSIFINQVNGRLFLTNPYCDTYHKCFNFLNDSKNIYCNGLSYLFNESIWTQETQPSKPYLFYFENKNFQETIVLKNSFIAGTSFSNSYMHNLTDDEFKVDLDNSCIIQYISNGYRRAISATIASTDEKFSVVSQKIKKRNGIVNVDLTLSIDTEQITLGQQYSIITLPEDFVPLDSFQFFGDIADSQWGVGDKLGYFYIGNKISITLPKGLSGTKFIRLHCSYLTKN